jgi:hypothetical protein
VDRSDIRSCHERLVQLGQAFESLPRSALGLAVALGASVWPESNSLLVALAL